MKNKSLKFSEKQKLKKLIKLKLLKRGNGEKNKNEFSEQQLREMIAKELAKAPEEINTAYIDLCFKLMKLPNPGKKTHRKNIRAGHVFAVAAVAALLVAAMTVTATANSFNIPENIAVLDNVGVSIRHDLYYLKGTATAHELGETYLAKELAKCRVEPISLPEPLTGPDCEITKIEDFGHGGLSDVDVSVDFLYKGNHGDLFIEADMYDPYELVESTWGFPGVKTGQMITVNGLEVLVFENPNSGIVVYKDDFYKCTIFLDGVSYDELMDFAKTLK